MASGTSIDLSLVGDHFMIGLRPGPELDRRDRDLLSRLRPAGIILYKSNFEHDAPYERWLDSHARLIRDIRIAVGRERLFIAIDHEGGRVCRTPPPITRYAYAARWAKSAERVGESMGRELSSLGFNLNFVPDLDIHSNPANPVIGERAFGRSATEVIAAAIPFMNQMERQGVRACGKHFPGHGDTSSDSHRELPVLNLPMAMIEGRELQPFIAAIDAGLAMVMTSHILFQAIDPDLPVTLSRKATYDLLRVKLSFQGVIISDDLGMHAMDGWLSSPESALRFFDAGNDMMMICSHWTDTERALGFAQALIEAQSSGRIDPDRLATSRSRVQRMLDTTAQNSVKALAEADFARHRASGLLFDERTVEVI